MCKTCLGDEKYLRMTKDNYGQDCKVCLKPFTVFRWCPGKGMRFRRTEICQTCCRLKNVCQSCILDLQYALPVQIRDGILQVKDACPQNEANREYFLATNAAKLARNDVSLIDYDATDPAAKAILEQLSQKHADRKSVQERNLPPPCSFYAKGTCKRGSECPYRHVLVADRPSSLKSYRDRYYGAEDPAAEAILQRNPELKDAINRDGATIASLQTPADRTVKSLFVMGIRDGLGEADIKEFFKAASVKLVAEGAAAIVTFETRLDAEEAAQEHLGLVEIKSTRVKVSWARSQSASGKGEKNLIKATEEPEQKLEVKKTKLAPPPPPSSSDKQDYSSRHAGAFDATE